LEEAHAEAATILYRALLNDILSRAKSAAYGHGARYLARLEELSIASEARAVPNMIGHSEFREGLLKAHGRKAGFWAQVRAKG